MNPAKTKNLLFFIICLISIFFNTVSIAMEVKSSHESINIINYKIRDLDIQALRDETIIIPPKLFKIWKSLTETLNFEVGGGIDFNLFKEVERVKMSYGTEESIAFLPDFEISWHTHPALPGLEITRMLRPPSVEDVIVAIAANYNLWLVLNNKLADDFSNALILRSYTEDARHPYVADVNLVTDLDGVYAYKANEEYWKDIWTDKKILQNELNRLKKDLQFVIDKYFIFAAENKLSVAEARKELLSSYRDMVHVDIEFIPWDDLLKNGLKVKLRIIELITNQRKQ